MFGLHLFPYVDLGIISFDFLIMAGINPAYL